MLNIARTTLSSKILSQDKEYFAKMAVDAVLHLRGSTDLERIQIIKKIPNLVQISSILAKTDLNLTSPILAQMGINQYSP